MEEAIDLNVEPEMESSCVTCSICLDFLTFDAHRSTARLQCGHQFHLDCIGSAFNFKGMMQCPNCRQIEEGQWLYASGPTNSSPEISMEDGGNENYPLYFNFAEMPYGVHICPFRGITPVHPSSESRLGTMTPMIGPQRPVGIPHPHPLGWVQFQHPPFHHHHQQSPMLTSGIDSSRSLPRIAPYARLYNPNPAFSLYVESPPHNYSHAWGGDRVPHFPRP